MTIFEGEQAIRTYDFANKNFWDHEKTKTVGEIIELDINDFDKDTQLEEAFVKENVAKLDTWTLIGANFQIVSGTKTCFTYENPENKKEIEEYCVLSQPWNDNYF